MPTARPRPGSDWTIEAIPAYNLKRGPAPGKLFHDKGRGNGYVLTYGGKRFYFSGDTEGVPEMRALKNIDVAFVCMNLPYTMPPEEAADAVKAFHPKVVIPYHYRGSDLTVFQKALEGTGIEVRVCWTGIPSSNADAPNPINGCPTSRAFRGRMGIFDVAFGGLRAIELSGVGQDMAALEWKTGHNSSPYSGMQ